MKSLFIGLMGALLTFPLSAQSLDRFVIGATGGEAVNASYQLEFTVGEAVVGTAETGTFVINQGFNQSNPPYNTSIDRHQIEASYRLYPNPTQDVVQLELILSEASDLTISLTDVRGRQVGIEATRYQAVTTLDASWDLSSLAEGMYLFQIFAGSGELVKALRIEKR